MDGTVILAGCNGFGLSASLVSPLAWALDWKPDRVHDGVALMISPELLAALLLAVLTAKPWRLVIAGLILIFFLRPMLKF